MNDYHDDRVAEDAKPTLPVYWVKRSQDFPAWLLVTCPRDDCAETFLVKASAWLKLRTYVGKFSKDKVVKITGRPCPYCYKSARIPARSAIKRA